MGKRPKDNGDLVPLAPAEGQVVRLLETASKALAEAKGLEELKAVRDLTQAMRRLAAQQRLAGEIKIEAAEIEMIAERRMGQVLAETVKRGGDRRSKSHRATLNGLPESISKDQSSRWQRAATVLEEDFTCYLSRCRANSTPASTAGVLRLTEPVEPPPKPRTPGQPMPVEKFNILGEADEIRALLARRYRGWPVVFRKKFKPLIARIVENIEHDAEADAAP